MMNYEDNEKISDITTCNGHLGGLLGEAILRFFLKENLIIMINNEYEITPKGWEELEIIGVDVDKLHSEKRKIVNICFESNHGILYEHLGAFLGSLLMQRIIELGWIKRRDEKNFMLTKKGLSGLESMGIKIKNVAMRQKSIY